MQNTKESGITLIVLIITVIIMIILAGIGLNYAIGEHGIIKRTEDASKLYQNAANNEIDMLNKIEQKYDSIIDKINQERKFTIYAIDADSKQGLSATIEIYNNKECTGTPLQTIEIIEGVYTTKDNILPIGTYYIKQKVVPVGYNYLGILEYKILGIDSEEWIISYNTGEELPAWNRVWTATAEGSTNWDELTGVKVTISPDDKVQNANFKMYYIGDIELVSGKATINYLEPYKTIIGTIDDEGQYIYVAKELATYMTTNAITEQYSGIAEGSNTWVQNDVPKGIYLMVTQRTDSLIDTNYWAEETAELVYVGIIETTIGQYTGASEISLTYSGGTLIEKSASIQVQINWEDSGHELERPVEIDVYLFRDGMVYDTMTFNKDNSWRHDWEGLDSNYEWSVSLQELSNYTYSIEKTSSRMYTIILTYKKSEEPDAPPPD